MARRHEARIDWKILAFYGLIMAVVVVIGGVAIWSFIERQALVIQPEPLPKITVVVPDTTSKTGAAWVRLLTRAELQPNLVPLETFDPIEGVVVFCDVEEIPPRLANLLDVFVHRGGAIAFVGKPPRTSIGQFLIRVEPGTSDAAIKLAESASPVLARLNPGQELATRRMPVTLIKESPRMVVDARWRDSARAAVMHIEHDGGRYLWLGVEPGMFVGDDRQLMLLLRTAFRWVSGQPVSDGAIGTAQVAKTLTPGARRDARENRFAFSVDRSPTPDLFTVRMMNRGGLPLSNPTVKVWLPPNVTKVALTGDFIMKRNATLTGVPEEGACLVSLARLTRNEDRVLKLKIVETRRISGGPAQQARR
jgi:hypothetical protein